MSYWLDNPYIKSNSKYFNFHDFFQKKQNIVYAGNSITSQKNGYCRKFHEELCQITRNQHENVTLGLGAIGSLGLASFWNLLIESKTPNVVFIETACADISGITPKDDIAPSLKYLISDRKSTRLNSSHEWISRMPSSA